MAAVVLIAPASAGGPCPAARALDARATSRRSPPTRTACGFGGDSGSSSGRLVVSAALAAGAARGAHRLRAGGGQSCPRSSRRRRRSAGVGTGWRFAASPRTALHAQPSAVGEADGEECEVIQFVNTDLCEGGDASSGTSKEGAGRSAEEEQLDPDELLTSEPSPVELALRAATFNSGGALLLLSYVPVFLKSKLSGFGDGLEASEESLEKEWKRVHEEGAVDLSNLISKLKGFYVKCGQVIATRSDLFPREYSLELSHMVDSVNPLPFSVVRDVVEQELLGGLPLDKVFERFDQKPLGSASIAQVHYARLRGGREVAVKVQRPFVEPRLMNDIGVIKGFSYVTRGLFPLDYYVVFSELEEQLQEEFDFIAEADAMDRLAEAMQREGRQPPVFIPRSVPGLTSRRVLCMDFVPGVPLSQLRAELQRRGMDVQPGSLAERTFGRGLLKALTEAFAVMIFEEGFFHADPHPGNVFVLPDSSVALIDFGQTKRIGYNFRRQLAELVLEICDNDELPEEDLPYDKFFSMADKMGVEFLPEAGRECAAALALWLIDTSREELPGGYESSELSPNCPVRDVASFPREFVLVCRTTLLIRGLAMRLGVRWSLARAWRQAAANFLEAGTVKAGGRVQAPRAAGAASAWLRPVAWMRGLVGNRGAGPARDATPSSDAKSGL